MYLYDTLVLTVLARVVAADSRYSRIRHREEICQTIAVLIRLIHYEVYEIETQLADVTVDSVDTDGAGPRARVRATVAGIDEVSVVVTGGAPTRPLSCRMDKDIEVLLTFLTGETLLLMNWSFR